MNEDAVDHDKRAEAPKAKAEAGKPAYRTGYVALGNPPFSTA
jgi:hypothetical protein